jgi:hypothetical protein
MVHEVKVTRALEGRLILPRLALSAPPSCRQVFRFSSVINLVSLLYALPLAIFTEVRKFWVKIP